ncbi:MAG: succinate dehydrogenase, cytochrome b556 subunit [Wolbachia sp.]|nr:succinate dehydrogenase, cytochrome b556 subunit [Wolbachia sp.]MDD9335809.1 succinate dehydrogenase, cytochrome b556 subunit [Wolbachia sp.]
MNNWPLSPHLQIYKVQVTSFFSVVHRLAGMLLFFLLIIFSWYFTLYVHFPELFIVRYLGVLLSSSVVKLVYIICFIGFAYHFLNGVRHLAWDMGMNLEVKGVSISAIILTITLILSSVAFLFMFI